MPTRLCPSSSSAWLVAGLSAGTRGVYQVGVRYGPEYFTLALWLAAGGVLLLVASAGSLSSWDKPLEP